MKMLFRKSLLFVGMILSLVVPYSSWACSVCGTNDGDIYLWTFLILMPLPFIVGGLIIWWVIRYNKKMAQSREK